MTSADQGEEDEGGNPAVEIGGFVRGELFLGKAPGEDKGEWKQGGGELALTFRGRQGNLGEGFAELRLRETAGSDGPEQELELRDAYVATWLGPLDLKLGNQIIVWGRADGINPTNNLTPYDMGRRSADEDDRRLANLALRTDLHLGTLRLEGVYVPLFKPSAFPAFELPSPLVLDSPLWPDTAFENGIQAVRLHYEGSILEASLSYLYGFSTFPGIEYRGIDTNGLHVGFRAYRHQVLGLDFSTTLGDYLGLRGEAAWRRADGGGEKTYTPLTDLRYVFGLDRELVTDLNLVVQYSGRYVFAWEALPSLPGGAGSPDPALLALLPESALLEQIRSKNRMLNGQLDRLSHGVVGRLQWALLQETLNLELAGLYTLTTEELMLRPSLVHDLADALEVRWGATVYRGPEGTLFGLIDERQSEVFAELRAWF